MPSTSARHQHRHYKTLIVLVLSMTSGTFLLFWVGKLSPVTPLTSLRGRTSAPVAPAAKVWNEIAVRTQDADRPRGFFHYRIAETGRLFQSSAWKQATHDPHSAGTIQILITCKSPDVRLTTAQTRTLTRLIGDLRATHGIPKDHVRVSAG
ncbi:MAG: N-acetylmuramoyl-L-alanine amidase [Phycisphaerae bacterium]|nr:N-acetylmuramoyl-L-alanine amidase [Phycisphaerae bacterium]